MLSNLRLAFRTLRKSPLFALVAIASLALGIGANTAVFSLVDQVLWRALPVKDPQSLVLLHTDGALSGHSHSDSSETVWSQPFYQDIRDRNTVFAGVAARSSTAVTLVAEGAAAERASAEMVSGSYFPMLGVRATVGRILTPEDDRLQGGHPVVMLYHGYWMRRFGGSRDVIGRKLLINGQPFTIVGVVPEDMPATVRGDRHDIVLTLAMQREAMAGADYSNQRDTHWLNIMARLKAGVSHEQATAGLAPLARAIFEQEADAAPGGLPARIRERRLARKVSLTPAAQGVNGLADELKTPMYTLLALVGLVLLITCINLANLLTVRAADRQREIAVRMALGGGRGRLLSQLLVEYALLGVIGALAGLVLGGWTLAGLIQIAGEDATFLASRIDAHMLVFNGATACAALLLFGLLPAWRGTKPDLTPALRDQSAGSGRSPAHARFRQLMVFAQVAVSTLLLVGAGLFARTLANLRNVNPGFRTGGVLAFCLDPGLNGYTRERGLALYEELERRLLLLPGVHRVAATTIPPLVSSSTGSDLKVEGYRPAEDEDTHCNWVAVSPGYFDTLGISLQGRAFQASDRNGSPKVAIINAKVAQDFFAGQNPIGRRIGLGGDRGAQPDTEIIGVAPTTKYRDLREKPRRMIFLPLAQEEGRPAVTFLLEGAADETRLGDAIRRVVADVDPGLPVFNMATMRAVRDSGLTAERLLSLLAGAFGALAALLAGLGLYGLLAYGVTRRRREFGVRLALGAEARDILLLLFRDSGLVVPAGLVAGLAGGYALGRFAESMLYGLRAWDAVTFAGSALGLGIVAMVAALLPARRAIGIDPASALRYE